MARKANPAMIGGFVLGALVLAVAALVVLGGGTVFQHRQFWEAYFDESIKGLAIGAPVTFRGVKVGSVTDIRVVVNRDATPATVTTGVMHTPVFFEISANRIEDTAGHEVRFEKDAAGIKRLFDFGLVAAFCTFGWRLLVRGPHAAGTSPAAPSCRHLVRILLSP